MIRFLADFKHSVFFTVSGKTCAVSDLNHHEVGEVPHEALSRDCHHRDEEWNSGKTKVPFLFCESGLGKICRYAGTACYICNTSLELISTSRKPFIGI